MCSLLINKVHELSVQRQRGHLAPMSWFSSAILVGEGGQQEFKSVNVWVAGRLVVVFWIH